MPAMSERNRYVLLHHVLRESAHWDLMLDVGAALATWQVLDSPADLAAGKTVRATRIGDHRRAYLDYEGPVSGGRGHVTRTDAGEYEIIERRENVWILRMDGAVLRGTYRLRCDAGSSESWTFERLASHGSGSIPSTNTPG